MGKRVVESYLDVASGRWKNRVVGGPDLPNEYLHLGDAAREGRGFADFLGCEFRMADDQPEPPEPPPPPAMSPELRAHAANGRIQALAARLERLAADETAGVEDALRAELAAQVAGQLAGAAEEYAVAALELAADLHRTEAEELEMAGEFERAQLQRKAAIVDDQLAEGRQFHPHG